MTTKIEEQAAATGESDDLSIPELVQAAEEAGLYYVMPGEPGIARRREGDEFIYLDPKGTRIINAKRIEKFEALVIPPAWTEVWICARPNGHILVTGRDAKGRKQYRYHPDWNEIRSQTKFSRIVQFGEALPALRARVQDDLRGGKLTQEKVVALVVHLLEETLIRVGNPEYARQNQSYGLTTLLDDHITVNGSRVTMAFVGKKGKPVQIDLRNRRLARLVKRCQELPGQSLFQYLDENGDCCRTVTSGDVNAYLRETTGQEFSAKDFRTWGGTVRAARELYASGPAADEKEAEKQIVQVVKTVSVELGNTPTICRKYYIHPGVLNAYRDGSLFKVMNASSEEDYNSDANTTLSAEEQAVLNLLRGEEIP